jgi:Integrase core domain
MRVCAYLLSGSRRAELLNREILDTLLEAKVLVEGWRQEYNTLRPHSSLGYRPPAPEAVQPVPLGLATLRQSALAEQELLTYNGHNNWGQVSQGCRKTKYERAMYRNVSVQVL